MRDAIDSSTGGAPFSGAIVAEGRFVFVAGQRPLRDDTYVEGTIDARRAGVHRPYWPREPDPSPSTAT